uniref:Uncharacterized protein n=1 Tax=Candidatus Kentrum sp. FM TaxID=2126340 RepID=A0A450U2R2_9GAMM|nr:MAG: hypothetical protein BECKFM1743C_GA0114222_109521 [Candidatus Kentron sp. FM]VFJ77403.1 MAG: hypothetical protein BECKFM1743A_GA0114220_109812 [Candidatus Kentron sp. FM]VFK07480.1 MAG: hypothetical protein BECKFM1743B_GA0114221_100416 [Candidatus Kentron sp. FM]
MLAILIVVAVSVISIMLTMAIEDTARLAMEKEGRIRVTSVRQLAEDARRYVREQGQYPSDLAALQSAAGFEHARHYPEGVCLQGRTVSEVVEEGANSTEYTSLGFDEDDKVAVDIDAINWRRFYDTNPSAQGCTVQGRGDDVQQPDRRTSGWSETIDERLHGEMLRQRRQMTRTLNKFAHYYNLKGAFPGESETGNLPSDAGVPNDACQGNYLWQDAVLLDCADVFSVWGTDIHLYRKTSHHIVLITSPDPSPDSESLYVSSELNLDISSPATE